MTKFLWVGVLTTTVIATQFTTPTHADSDVQCPTPGYYLNNGVCTICELGYYCPGNNAQIKCTGTSYADETGQSECKTCPTLPDEYKKNFYSYWYWTDKDINDRITACRVLWRHITPHGNILFSCSYGTEGSYTQPGIDTKCVSFGNDSCSAGYWVDPTNPIITRGSSAQFWVKSYYDMINTEFCVPVGPGYYSPAGTTLRTACPNGRYSDKGPDAASAGYGLHGNECVSLCAAGATEFHAGNHIFNLYPTEACANPAIRIELPRGECCVHLEIGKSNTAVNIDYNGTTYHTTN